jgi:hypothetical protein
MLSRKLQKLDAMQLNHFGKSDTTVAVIIEGYGYIATVFEKLQIQGSDPQFVHCLSRFLGTDDAKIYIKVPTNTAMAQAIEVTLRQFDNESGVFAWGTEDLPFRIINDYLNISSYPRKYKINHLPMNWVNKTEILEPLLNETNVLYKPVRKCFVVDKGYNVVFEGTIIKVLRNKAFRVRFDDKEIQLFNKSEILDMLNLID